MQGRYMDILEKYHYDLTLYADREWDYIMLYSYEPFIQNEVIQAKETADQVWDHLTLELTKEKDQFQLEFQ